MKPGRRWFTKRQRGQQSFRKYHRAGRQKLELRPTSCQGFEGTRSWKIKRHREVSPTFSVLSIRHLPIPYWAVSEVKKLSKKQLKRRRVFLAISQHWVNKNWNSGLPRKRGSRKHSSLSSGTLGKPHSRNWRWKLDQDLKRFQARVPYFLIGLRETPLLSCRVGWFLTVVRTLSHIYHACYKLCSASNQNHNNMPMPNNKHHPQINNRITNELDIRCSDLDLKLI